VGSSDPETKRAPKGGHPPRLKGKANQEPHQMTTLTQPRRSTKPAPPVHGVCRLTLNISGTKYRVKPIRPGFAGRKAFQLRKTDGMRYTVVRTLEDTINCDCGDYAWRRDGLTDQPCKHGAALVACGLL